MAITQGNSRILFSHNDTITIKEERHANKN